MFYPVVITAATPQAIAAISRITVIFKACKHLSMPMFCALFFALVFVPMNSQANENNAADELTRVYKVIGEDGSVSFSDQPKAESETLMIPPISTVPAISPGKASFPSQADKNNKPYQRYHSLSVLAPANNSAFYSGSGEIDVLLDIKPALLSGDQIQIFLDGQLIQSNDQIQSRLQTVSRGTHELSVKLVSQSGKVYKESSSTFTVHRPSIRN